MRHVLRRRSPRCRPGWGEAIRFQRRSLQCILGLCEQETGGFTCTCPQVQYDQACRRPVSRAAVIILSRTPAGGSIALALGGRPSTVPFTRICLTFTACVTPLCKPAKISALRGLSSCAGLTLFRARLEHARTAQRRVVVVLTHSPSRLRSPGLRRPGRSQPPCRRCVILGGPGVP